MKIRRWSAVLLAVTLCVLLVSQMWAAAADEPLDLSRECKLTVSPSNNKEMIEDLSTVDLVVDLYRIADLTAGQDGYSFSTVEQLKYLSIPQNIASKEWADVAQRAAKEVLPPNTAKPYMENILMDKTVTLPTGLYLLVAHERGDTDYVKNLKDENGIESVVTQVRTEKYLYTFAPELVSLPTKEPDSDTGEINTANPGEWIYDLSVSLKPKRDDLSANLEIVKKLPKYEGSEPATFVFQIDWELDGKKYSDVRTITFTSSGERTLTMDIPVGAKVTVTEVYSGVAYTVSGDASKTVVIEADTIARVEFENLYNEQDPPPNTGGSITNKFTYSDGAWHLNAQVDSTEE